MTDTRPQPPHPHDYPLLGSLPDFARDILGTVLKGWRELGDLARFRGPRTMTLAAHPDYVQRVMEERWQSYPRSEVVRNYLRGIMGDSVFVSEGEERERRRRIVESVLQSDETTRFVPVIVEAATAVTDRWQDRREIDVAAEMMQLALDALKHMLFGSRPPAGAEDFESLVQTAVEFAIPRVMSPVNPPEFLPAGRRYRRALERLDGMLYEAIAARRSDPGDDLVSAFLEARDETTGRALSDKEVRDEVMTAVFGVYKGIPHALTWTWYCLSQNPNVRDRLTSEVDAVVAGAPTEAELPRLSYTTAVLQETLRLYPPLWIWSRPPTEDDEIAGYHIPAGMFILMIPYVTHRHPAFWTNPEGFDPNRFASGDPSGRHPCAYFPFAAGPRRCVGETLAMMELKIVVATIARQFHLDLVPGTTIERALEFILRPKGGLPMRVVARSAGEPEQVETATASVGA
jgi:cytochrome P450